MLYTIYNRISLDASAMNRLPISSADGKLSMMGGRVKYEIQSESVQQYLTLWTRASEAGGMQGIWHPNYLCGGILICISPLEKPNQWSKSKIRARGTLSPPFVFHPPSAFLFPYPFLPSLSPFPSPPLPPLEVGPLNPARGSRGAL